MANYKESAVTGTEWTRSRVVVINHEYEQVSECHFGEETRFAKDGGVSVQVGTGGCSVVFSQGKTFPKRDPDTGEILEGTYSHDEVRAIMYSLYMDTAEARDLAQTP